MTNDKQRVDFPVGENVREDKRGTPRGRLAELIDKSQYEYDGSKAWYEQVADYLLANGVIVPPCKVGDKYVMDTAKTIFKAWNDVTGAVCEGTSWYYELESVIEDIVKLSFGAGVLYREEAEQALNNIQNGNSCDDKGGAL